MLKKFLTSICFILVAITANAEVTQTKTDANSQTFGFKNFSHISIQGTWNAKIIAGNQYQVMVNAAKLDPKLFSVEQKGDTVNITNAKIVAPNRFNLTIMLPQLSSLEVRGTDSVEVSGFNVKDLFVSIEGTQMLLGVNNQIGNLKLYAAGTTTIDFKNSKTQNVNLQILGTSTTKLNMQGGDLVGQAKGTVSIAYWGTVKSENVTPGPAITVEKQQ